MLSAVHLELTTVPLYQLGILRQAPGYILEILFHFGYLPLPRSDNTSGMKEAPTASLVAISKTFPGVFHEHLQAVTPFLDIDRDPLVNSYIDCNHLCEKTNPTLLAFRHTKKLIRSRFLIAQYS